MKHRKLKLKNVNNIASLGFKNKTPVAELTAVVMEELHKQSVSVTAKQSPLLLKCITELSAARIAVIISAALYGFNYIASKELTTSDSQIHPSLNVAIRFFIGFLPYIPIILKANIPIGLRFEVISTSVELGLWCAVGFIAQAFMLVDASTVKVALYTSLATVLIPMFEGLDQLIKSKASSSKESSSLVESNNHPAIWKRYLPFLRALLAVVGVVLVQLGEMTNSNDTALSDSVRLQTTDILEVIVGEMKLLASPFAFAMCLWKMEDMSHRFASCSTAIMGLMILTTAVSSLLWAIYSSDQGVVELLLNSQISVSAIDTRSLLGYAYIGLCGTTIPSLIETWSLSRISASELTLFYSLEPVFTMVFTRLLYDSPLDKGVMIGGALIVLACSLAAIH